ncbi:MAG: hypothetical protein ACNA8P_12910, partial [Phycisphaerales bacterium]
EQPDTLHDPHAELVAFLAGRSAPCPRCDYDLRDICSAVCPECAEPLVLKIGSPRARFGWLLFAMAPGCFSGVAACFLAVPITVSIWHTFPAGLGVPWPILGAEVFGLTSAGSVWLMYRHRQRFLSWRTKRQATLAAAVWATHLTVFVLLIVAMNFWI